MDNLMTGYDVKNEGGLKEGQFDSLMHERRTKQNMDTSKRKIDETVIEDTVPDDEDSIDDDFVTKIKKPKVEDVKKQKKKIIEVNKEDKQKNVKGKKPVADEDFPGLANRMSPNSVYLAMKRLSKEQRQMIRDMGFGVFLEIKVDSFPSRIGYYEFLHLTFLYNQLQPMWWF